MDSSRRNQLEELYRRALVLPADQRNAFVISECPDSWIREELLSRLGREPDAPTRLDGPTEPLTRSASAPAAGPSPGRPERIGRYQVEREIGSGGMGRVYLARLGPDSAPVAIKVLRREIVGPEALRRFAVERSFLAGIDHPNIARLLDAGTTDSDGAADGGRPYFVMEFIDGVPIDSFCEQNTLGLQERLRLFRKLCGAVHFAHQNLVVHRDIKPGNILVTPDGEPKLLDFGIAKFLDPSGLRWQDEDTAAHVRLFTPDYASPEQVLGEPITTATDVYSLGAVLYLLLTGRPVRRFDGHSYPQIMRSVSETTPERPSTAVTRAAESDAGRLPPAHTGWQRRLRGDLDAIVMKTLRREPEQRYPSAVDLSDDLVRHLEGQPVVAHRGGRRYRAAKFVRRHRVALAAATIFLISLVSFSWATARARNRAELEAARAQAINHFLTNDLLEAADPRRLHGADVTMKVVLDAAADRLEGRFDGEPLIEADIRRSLGATYHHLGDYEAADPHLRRALELRERELGRLAEPTIAALSNLANLQSDRAEYDEAMALQEDAAARVRAALPPDHPYRLSIVNNLASLYSERGRVEEAEPLYREVLEERTRSIGPDDIGTIVTAVNLARLWARTGRQAEALELLEDSLGRSARALGAEHPHTFRIGTYLASLYNRLGRYEDSEALHRRNLEGQIRAQGERHPDTLTTRNNLAVALMRQGKNDEAHSHFEQVLDVRREILGNDHPSTLMSMHNMAGIELERGRAEAAVALSHEAVEAADSVYPPSHLYRHLFASRLGVGLVNLGDFDAAEPLLLESYPPLEEQLGADHPGTRSTAEALVALYERRGSVVRAAEWQRKLDSAG